MAKPNKGTNTLICFEVTEDQLSKFLINLVPIETTTPGKERIIITCPVKDDYGLKLGNCADHILSAFITFRNQTKLVENIPLKPVAGGKKYFCILWLLIAKK